MTTRPMIFLSGVVPLEPAALPLPIKKSVAATPAALMQADHFNHDGRGLVLYAFNLNPESSPCSLPLAGGRNFAAVQFHNCFRDRQP